MWQYNNFNELYHSEDYPNELYHYGVVGMKWGRRKTARIASSAQQSYSKANSSKTKLAKQFHTYNGARKQLRADLRTNRANSKNLRDYISNSAGLKRAETVAKANANYNRAQAKNSYTRLGKHMQNISEYNNRQKASELHTANKQKGIVKKRTTLAKSTLNGNRKTMVGRKSNNSARLVDNALTLGTVGTLKDMAYVAKKRKKK